jgi:hypothetical protein
MEIENTIKINEKICGFVRNHGHGHDQGHGHGLGQG